MADKRKDITQEICDQVKFLIKGGATNKKAGAFVGLSATTISRIRTAGYSAEGFRKNNEARREEEKAEYKLTDPGLPTLNRFEKKDGSYACAYTGEIEDKSGMVLTPEGPLTREELRAAVREFQDAANQVPGQLAMDLPTEKDRKMVTVEVSVPQDEPIVLVNEQKMMRFLAGKLDGINIDINKVRSDIQAAHSEMSQMIFKYVSAPLDKIYDYLGQILRRMDK